MLDTIDKRLGISEQVEKLWPTFAIKAMTTWLDRAFISSSFLKRYLKQVQIDYESLNIKGLSLIAANAPKLENVFVAPNLSCTNNLDNLNLDLHTVEQLNNAHTIWEWLKISKNNQGNTIALAIIGAPGSGKTTLLQHVALTFAANRQSHYDLPAYVPIALSLPEHAAIIFDNPAITIDKVVYDYFDSKEEYLKLNLPKKWLEAQLIKGKWLVLLDGLDAVARTEVRVKVSAWIDRQIVAYPQCQFIITSRPQGYKTAPLAHAKAVVVQNFNWPQAQKLMKNWCLANATLGDKVSPEVKPHTEQEFNNLLQQLSKSEAHNLQALTANPLLLTMLMMVYCYRGTLPGSRGELYKEICTLLLEHAQPTKTADTLTPNQQLTLLRPLATQMMLNKNCELSTAAAWEIIAPWLPSLEIKEPDAEKMLQELQFGKGLLITPEKDRYRFAHLTFQEYLTATAWQKDNSLPVDLSPLVTDSWWQETLQFYATNNDATPVLQTCLQTCLTENSAEALKLAIEILAEGQIHEEIRAKVHTQLELALESDHPQIFQVAAETYLNRRLNKVFQPIDEQVALDLSFVSCAEFQLFVNAMLPEKCYQPGHWSNNRFPKGQAKAPVLGIMGESASAFCKWLTEWQNSQSRQIRAQYRLPQTKELKIYQKGTALKGTYQLETTPNCIAWCRDDQSAHLLPSDEQLKALKISIKKVLPDLTTFYEKQGLDLTYIFHQYWVFANNNDLASDLANARDLAGKLMQAISRDRVSASALVTTSTRATTIASALDRAIVSARDHASTRDRAHDLAHARELANALDIARARALASALDHQVSLDLALNRAIIRATKEITDLIVKTFDDLIIADILHNFEVDLRSIQNQQFDWTTSCATRNWLLQIKASLLEWQTANADKPLSPLIDLLIKLSSQLNSDKPPSPELAPENRQVLLELLNYFPKNPPTHLDSEQQQQWQDVIKGFYLYIKIIDARAQGELLAWEGIQLARELKVR
jgi:NACHT domain